ncbi:hypothetical protein OsJ_05910 [Oryza sativa Japonica Group]|uniref:Uncharacterized protein n=1 Tax=Oryza sativa subsp. japonica TaxID=39947 RepID=A3A4L6_ORYSJ|nr:hypothetical protein OsJ_05910 [Oryza sativa Japonica Group]
MAPPRANSGDGNDGAVGGQSKLSPSGLLIREIPGGYGVPFLSPLRDRLDYYYFQGADEFFRSRVARHGGATVLRVNMPPGPFLAGDPRVVALLDARSFRVLLDDSMVDKADTLDGTFMPSLALFGGHRPLAFLDAADPRHAKIKRVVMSLAAARMHHVAPAFRAAFAAMFDEVDAGLVAGGPVEFNKLNMRYMLDFTCAALFGGAPPSKAMGDAAVTKAVKWLIFQLHPLASKVVKPWPAGGPPPPHLPPAAVPWCAASTARSRRTSPPPPRPSSTTPRRTTRESRRDELLHNLVFVAVFNAYGGFKIFLPHIVKWLARAGPELHAKLASEVRAAAPAGGGEITISAVEKEMPLVKSVVWEALRMNPPVEFQYGRARRDMVVESHDAAYEVRKGELLFGYQPLATRDEKVFDRAGEFVPDRFVSGAGSAARPLLEHVVWSNGPETGTPSEGNKQCPGKDMVVAVGRLMVAGLFRRYDTFAADVEELPLEPVVTFTSLTRAADGDGAARRGV